MQHIAPEYTQIIAAQRLAELDRRTRSPRPRPTRPALAPRPGSRLAPRLRHVIASTTAALRVHPVR